jgi:hypothetical protein
MNYQLYLACMVTIIAVFFIINFLSSKKSK